MEYYSHFDRAKGIKQELPVHLENVAQSCAKAVVPTVKFPNMPNSAIKDMAYNLGFTHDIGKYTDDFQRYLQYGAETKYKNHAHISAFYTHASALRSIMPFVQKPYDSAWAFLAYLCVRLHHGNLTLSGLFSNDSIWGALENQARHLMGKSDTICTQLSAYERLLFLQDSENVMKLKGEKKLFIHMPVHLTKNGRLSEEHWFFVLIYLFSILIDSDKLDAGHLSRREVVLVPEKQIINYVHEIGNNKKNEQINDRRDEARRQMLQVMDSLTDEQLADEYLFTITAPTGIGKTLASLHCALKLQERLQKLYHYTPRIITGIPFINIIEQTVDVYKAVIRDTANCLVHHSLSDLYSSSRDHPTAQNAKEDIPVEQRLLEVESWEADVVLTTFVQLFQSIFTGRNRSLKKINKLAGSIVILDEVQSIPEEYMPLIGATLRKMGQYYGTRFILMTATQPKIVELGDRLLQQPHKPPVDLLPNADQYFKQMERTKFIPLLNSKLNNESFIELFYKYRNPNQSALIVVNTIKRANDLYQMLRTAEEQSAGNCDHVFHLSTNLVPEHRRKIIKQIKELMGKKPVILVSTQTIEAGVDLDFDIGFRDLAPITSLIQTAGRVNREGIKGEFCPVYIVEFEKDQQMIYDKHHINRTRQLLQDKESIEEPDYLNLVNDYYDLLARESFYEKSKKIWYEGVVGLDFDVLEEFELIPDKGEVVDVFVEFGDRASLLADAYEELRKGIWPGKQLVALFGRSSYMEEPVSDFAKKAILEQVIAQMGNYMIQIRLKRFLQHRPISFNLRNGVEANWYWVPKEQLADYYDERMGYIDPTGASFVI